MIQVFGDFQEGERFQAKVEETLLNNELIINYLGHLKRVANDTGRKFHKGDALDLVVISRNPLKIQIYAQYLKSFNRYI